MGGALPIGVDRRRRGAAEYAASACGVTDAAAAAEIAARASYGRLLALLAARWRDVARAEDALGDALLAALETWPRSGVPDNPEAWLLTAARRRLVDGARHATVSVAAEADLRLMLDERLSQNGRASFPDQRLALLFVCAHPDIDEAARTPLMLQTVLGLDAARIASAFLMAPATMSQRLVRVKARIREAGIRFEVPERAELAARLDAVLEAIYAAYGSGWEDVAGADPRRRGLAEEAIWLGRLVTRLRPDEPEALGLLALMLHCEARRTARRDARGAYVPLREQDVTRWSLPMLEEAERLLEAAARGNALGRFQLEAAIQSAHAQRMRTGATDWEAIALLYEGLLRCAPTVGARVAHAAALEEARGADAGLAALDAIPLDAVAAYQPYWALRAQLLKQLGHTGEARDAYDRAIGLSEEAAVREFLLARVGELR
jgi:predicted RNA polymerase sigma factor